MADLTVTAASVVKGSNAEVETGTAGAAITAGQSVYKSSADNKFYKAQANAATTDDCYGIALNSAPGAGQPLTVHRGGDLDIGATLTVGETYVLSAAAAGGVAPIGDLGSGNYVTHIGVADAADNLIVNLFTSSAAKP